MRRSVPAHAKHALLAILGLALVAGAGCGARNGGDPSPVVSVAIGPDTSRIIGPGDTIRLHATVHREDGAIEEATEVTWISSMPAVVAVDTTGLLTGGNEIGQTEVIAEVDGIASEPAWIYLAHLQPQTVSIASDVVIGREAGALSLSRTEITESLEPGAILATGDTAGVLARILSVDVGADRVDVTVEQASLAEAFERLEVTFEPMEASERLMADDDGAGLGTQTQDLGQGRQALVRYGRIECETEGSMGETRVEGASFEADAGLRPLAGLRIEGGSVQSFRLGVSAWFRLDASAGSVAFSASAKGELHCQAELEGWSFPGFRIGPFFANLDLIPLVGVEGSISFDGPQFELFGPEGHIYYSTTYGIQYANGGWSVIEQVDRDLDLIPFRLDLDLDFELEASLAPYVGADAGITFNAGVDRASVEMLSLRFAEARLYGKAEVGFATPFDPTHRDYTGPAWGLFLGANASVKLEPSSGVVVDLMGWLGVPVSGLGTFELFSVEVPVLEAPKPEMRLTDDWVIRSRRHMPGVDVGRAYAGEAVEFWAYKDGSDEAIRLGDGAVNYQVSSTGVGAGSWRPEASDNGLYEVFALVFDDRLGEVGLPYRSDSAMLEVDIHVPETEEDPAVVSPTRDRLAMGSNFAGALADDGGLYVWGRHAMDRLGAASRETPVLVAGGPELVSITAGGASLFGLTESGELWAMGANGNGILGLGYASEWETEPVRVGTWRDRSGQEHPLTNVVAVTAGRNAALAVLASGAIVAWGRNEYLPLRFEGPTVVQQPTEVPWSGDFAVDVVIAPETSSPIGRFNGAVLDAEGKTWSWLYRSECSQGACYLVELGPEIGYLRSGSNDIEVTDPLVQVAPTRQRFVAMTRDGEVYYNEQLFSSHHVRQIEQPIAGFTPRGFVFYGADGRSYSFRHEYLSNELSEIPEFAGAQEVSCVTDQYGASVERCAARFSDGTVIMMPPYYGTEEDGLKGFAVILGGAGGQ